MKKGGHRGGERISFKNPLTMRLVPLSFGGAESGQKGGIR